MGIAEENFVEQRDVPTGSIGFMAPEVARGEAATPTSDIFSVGATLHFALTGQIIFPQIPLHDLEEALRHVFDTTPCLQVDSRFPKLLALVEQCVALRPKERPDSAAWVAAQIEEALHSECVGSEEIP